jgi:hypothetical protein
MAASGSAQTAADAAGAAPWHERLHARLAEAERAVAALLSVCEEPAAQDALEARLRCAVRLAAGHARETTRPGRHHACLYDLAPKLGADTRFMCAGA